MKYFLTEEIIQEIINDVSNFDVEESRNGYIILYDSFQKDNLKHCFSFMKLKGNMYNNRLVFKFGKSRGYRNEAKAWQVLPFRFNEKNEDFKNIKRTLQKNYWNSALEVTKFLIINPSNLFLYSISKDDIKNKTFPRDETQMIENLSINSLTEEEKDIISQEKKKLEELIRTHYKFTRENVDLIKRIDIACKKVCGRVYDPKLISRGYLFYE